MLKNIKSSFFIKFLFSNLKHGKKLAIIKYCKSLQDIMYINLIDYKIFKGNCIIYETKTKGKEYNYKGLLEYDGEYLNGKKNGKGKEYIPVNTLIYEGEYLDGKRNGKGKEYHITGELIFEGEYLNGEKNGKGKEYHLNGKTLFEGEFKKGKRWNGIQYDEKTSKQYELKDGKGFMQEYDYGGRQILIKKEYLNFEGEFLNGIRNGKGKEYDYENRLIFEGEYLNGKRWNGEMYDRNHNLISELKDGNGFVKEWNYFSEIFEGDYLHGERNGNGKEFGNNSIVDYEGEYLNDKRNGKGKEYDYNGRLIFEGEYLDGNRNGKGKEFNYKNELMFEGEYSYNWRRRGKDYVNWRIEFEGEYLFNKKWTGKGYDENGNVDYELIDGNGTIKEYDDKGSLKYEGQYLNGKRNGMGKEYGYGGKLKYQGEFLNGKRKK